MTDSSKTTTVYTVVANPPCTPGVSSRTSEDDPRKALYPDRYWDEANVGALALQRPVKREPFHLALENGYTADIACPMNEVHGDMSRVRFGGVFGVGCAFCQHFDARG